MENVLVNVENIIVSTDSNMSNDKNSKIDQLLLYLKMKRIIKSERAQQMIKKYIDIENGKKYIKGTRISTDTIGNFVCINEIKNSKELLKEYPSLECEEEVITALFCYVLDNISLLKLLLGK